MQKNRTTAISYIILIVASTLFMLFFAYNTSPFSQYLGVDSGMYLVIGKAMAQGEPLYASLFDHKGPIIFIINMLPQLLMEGTIGIWITELCLITISASILYKIANRNIGHPCSFCAPLVYIWITVTLFNGGNYTEEYSNFFCVISLFVFDKWQRDKTLSPSMIYILGLCLAFVTFLRPNNVALIVSVILFIGLYIIKKSRNSIKTVFIFGCLGLLTVTLPIMIYHLSMGTLYDMFYATFLHNINYCKVGIEAFRLIPNGNNQQLLCFFIAFGLIIVAMCICYSSDEINMGNFIILSSTIISLAILISRRPFIYYWTLLAPLSSYSVVFIIKFGMNSKKNSKAVIALLLILPLMFLNSFLGTEVAEKKSYIMEYKRKAHQMYDVIPHDEKKDCFAFNMPSMFIYEVDLYTPCKYFTMQTWMAKTDPDIEKYCTYYVKENKPKWILSYFPINNTNISSELSEIIMAEYTEVFNNNCGFLYRKAEGL
ncbi:hypothetical protein [Anaerotignum sp.]|uniref:hypothetical protein n=1 Tax=Anaerotignum sp. TaxID=2039241 RepID=UPI00331D28FD